MNSLEGSRIILGVTGSIAAVKSGRIASELRARGADVFAVATDSALRFTTLHELHSETGHEVIATIFREAAHERFTGTSSGVKADTWHVAMGRAADAMVIAPCSATTIGKLRAGIYDNAVTLVSASLRKGTPLFIAPAMDEDMWVQPAVQDSLAWLVAHGVRVIGPVSGPLASGLVGMGRMTEPQDIAETVAAALERSRRSANQLSGKHVLITAGPTYEPIDPVRFIGNRSSGKMGVALAAAAEQMGAHVTLVIGPSVVRAPSGVERVDVETAEEMLQAVRERRAAQDILIMSAAVSDFAPARPSETKLKKREAGGAMTSIELRPTVDILAESSRKKRNGQIIVGFALEKGEASEDYARGKLIEKDLDLIVMNNIANAGAGFGHETNQVTLFTRTGERIALPLMSKDECARRILEQIVTLPNQTQS